MVSRSLPFVTVVMLAIAWELAARRNPQSLLPAPLAVLRGIGELLQKGLLFKYIVASLFRVTWGYLLAALVAVPFGLLLGWHRRAGCAIAPLLHVCRPISPLAWIPIAILWFGVGDVAAVFLIFLASFLPITVASMNAVKNIDGTHLRAGRNFGLSEVQLIRWVVYPAVMPQLIVGLRITLGIAWLVVVAAEMIAVNSGLGFLIIDARNEGNRYDLVVAGMVLIGVVGVSLDTAMRRLERLKSLRSSYGGIR
jgi:NitT/TauT family transport system permease protein